MTTSCGEEERSPLNGTICPNVTECSKGDRIVVTPCKQVPICFKSNLVPSSHPSSKDQSSTAANQRCKVVTDCTKLSSKSILGSAKSTLVLPIRTNRTCEESDGEQYQTSQESSDSEDVSPSDEGMFSAGDLSSTESNDDNRSQPESTLWNAPSPTAQSPVQGSDDHENRQDNEDEEDDDNRQDDEEEEDNDYRYEYPLEDDLSMNLVINGKQMDMSSERYSVLSFEQVVRLDSVMNETMPIHGRGNFPTLEVKLKHLVQVVRSKLLADGVTVRDIRLNGGAASYVLSSVKQHTYTDLDLIFGVDLSNHRTFDRVRSAVLDSLLDLLPEDVNKKRMSSCTLKEAYVHKMVKVTEGGDRWSLISLCNNMGRDVEIKFVDSMKRQFEFSVDSFQIILDSLLLFYECSNPTSGDESSIINITENIYPTVVGESVYGNFNEALRHLQREVIATRNPEEIRGGGLLKYCRLQVMGYRPAKYDEIKNLEKYMCSRFFIDFPDIQVQRVKLANYLKTHFQEDDQTKYDYLMILYEVVDESTVCLMGHERRQTLSLIEEFAYHFYCQNQQKQMVKNQYSNPPPPLVQSIGNHPVSSCQQQQLDLSQQQLIHHQQGQVQVSIPGQQQTTSTSMATTTFLVGSGNHFFLAPVHHHNPNHHHHHHPVAHHSHQHQFHNASTTYTSIGAPLPSSNPTNPLPSPQQQQPHYHHHHHHHHHPSTTFGCAFTCCGHCTPCSFHHPPQIPSLPCSSSST